MLSLEIPDGDLEFFALMIVLLRLENRTQTTC